MIFRERLAPGLECWLIQRIMRAFFYETCLSKVFTLPSCAMMLLNQVLPLGAFGGFNKLSFGIKGF